MRSGDASDDVSADAFDDATPVPIGFSCAVRRESTRAIVSFDGDIDIASAAIVHGALRDAATGPAPGAAWLVVADFAGVSFIDSSGVQALLSAQRAAAGVGSRIVVRGAQRNVAMVFEVLGLTDQLVAEEAP